MGFRFRKRIKLFPGIWFNLSKSGVSTSIGGKGVTVNLKDGKTMTTTSVPGTGLSYRETIASTPDDTAPRRAIPAWFWVLLIVVAVVVLLVR